MLGDYSGICGIPNAFNYTGEKGTRKIMQTLKDLLYFRGKLIGTVFDMLKTLECIRSTGKFCSILE